MNTDINRKMIDHAVQLLSIRGPTTMSSTCFCGIGNFTLCRSRATAGRVVGVGDAGLVERARRNAESNAIANAEFFTADLYGELQAEPWMTRQFDKALLDPPRSGALQVLPLLPAMGVRRIVYVSCYPGTLARDAGELVVNTATAWSVPV